MNSIQDALERLGSAFGFNTTSAYRTPDFNSSIGGVNNSQHTLGTARDYSVQGKSWSEIQNFMNGLRNYGFEAIYESSSDPHSTGPHVHAEIPDSAPTSNCPSWIPAKLCSGYNKIASSPIGKGALAGATGGALGAAGVLPTASLSDLQLRVALFAFAIILITVSLVYVFKDTALDVAGGPIAKIGSNLLTSK
jgi:hypothetical protein